jgi:hypothetical protein
MLMFSIPISISGTTRVAHFTGVDSRGQTKTRLTHRMMTGHHWMRNSISGVRHSWWFHITGVGMGDEKSGMSDGHMQMRPSATVPKTKAAFSARRPRVYASSRPPPQSRPVIGRAHVDVMRAKKGSRNAAIHGQFSRSLRKSSTRIHTAKSVRNWPPAFGWYSSRHVQ